MIHRWHWSYLSYLLPVFNLSILTSRYFNDEVSERFYRRVGIGCLVYDIIIVAFIWIISYNLGGR